MSSAGRRLTSRDHLALNGANKAKQTRERTNLRFITLFQPIGPTGKQVRNPGLGFVGQAILPAAGFYPAGPYGKHVRNPVFLCELRGPQ
jgi:hypothetical protein